MGVKGIRRKILITEFVINHFIPIWIFFGFLTLLLLILAVSVLDSENVFELLQDDWIDLWKVIACGPVGLIILLYSFVLERKMKREQKRKEASWWELKEFGGKY